MRYIIVILMGIKLLFHLINRDVYKRQQQELTFGILFKGKINFMDPQTSCVEENRQAMGELGYDYIKSCEETCPMLHFSSFIEKEKPWNPVCVMPGLSLIHI